MPGYKKTKKKTKNKQKKDKYALKIISDLSKAKKKLTDNKIKILEERIAKLNQELSAQKHLENVKNHKLTFDSIRHGLDQLTPKQKDQITQELITSIMSEPDSSKLFTKSSKKGIFSDKRQYIIDLISSGVDGDVYKVKYRQHTTAIKVIDQKESKKMDKLMKEIYILSTLNKFKNFLRYYSYFIKDDKLFIIMECYDGEEYYKQHNKLSNIAKMNMFMNLLTSIYEMHKSDIIHNDLHMANVLYKSSSNFRIIDFGRAICYGTFKHKYCEKPHKLKKYSHKKGFSGGYKQVAPWRSKQCGNKKGCSKLELMAGDLWALCYNFSDLGLLGKSTFKKYLEDKYHVDGGKAGWDKCAYTFLEELPSIYKNYTGKELPKNITEFYLSK
jgi:tRNA A-37 threonylcarbamoyl transferase component Bud32